MGAALSCSCTVKEERAGCPCYLTLDLNLVNRELLKEGGNGVLAGAAVTMDGACHSAGFFSLDDESDEWTFSVPRGKLWLCVWSDEKAYNGSDVSIPVGEECPQVWMSRGEVDCAAEEKRDTVILHKRWCTVRVALSGAGSASSRAVEVSSVSCGYDEDGCPKTGEFFFLPSVVADRCSFRIPQQVQDDLSLRILSCGFDGELTSVRIFWIGRYLSESGYDWEAEDLSDVDVAIDFTTSSLSLSFEGVRYTHRFELKI